MAQGPVALGLDFGTDSARAVLIGLEGLEHAAAVEEYPHGQITERLPGAGTSAETLPADYALQHPMDWLDAASRAIRVALAGADLTADDVIGIGVDFTSCTMLPCMADGQPMCVLERWSDHPHAWPKLWKHHGAKRQTDDLNRAARKHDEPWLARYGGTIGLEWLFPKMLEIFDDDPEVFDATEVFVEGGDWLVWQLTGAEADQLPRSTCQAGYKACWSATDGYPARQYLNRVRHGFGDAVLDRLPGQHLAPGTPAGELGEFVANELGLNAGTPVATAIIDAHAGVPGAGVGDADTLVIVMGTSSCHMLCSRSDTLVPGVAGVVADGILPGFTGYEMGQAAVGDAFAWLRRTTGQSLDELAQQADSIAPGADGMLCIDWFNGCRTPLMDGSRTASLHGLTLGTSPAHLYRAILEGTAFGTRWIVELMREHDVPITSIVLTGGLPHAHPIVAQTYADVLDMLVAVHPARHGPAVGAAILGAVAAGQAVTGFASIGEAVDAMAAKSEAAIEPRAEYRSLYDAVYHAYRHLAQ